SRKVYLLRKLHSMKGRSLPVRLTIRNEETILSTRVLFMIKRHRIIKMPVSQERVMTLEKPWIKRFTGRVANPSALTEKNEADYSFKYRHLPDLNLDRVWFD